MATRFINRGLDIEHQGGHFVMVAFDRNDNLATKLLNGAGTVEDRFVPLEGTEAVTSSKTITYSDHGKTFIMDSTTSIALQLPATKKGITYSFVVKQLTTSTGHSFSPISVDKIMGNGFTSADNKDAICSAATDREGDTITIVGDGLDGWYIISVIGTFAREA